MIAYLEGALQFAEEIKDADTAHLIERALDGRAFDPLCQRQRDISA
jgi:hypothetical protein